MFIFSSCKTDNSKESDVVNKIKGFVRTKKVTSSDLSISDYFKDVLKTKGPNAYLRIEIKASLNVDGSNQEKTFYIDAFADGSLN